MDLSRQKSSLIKSFDNDKWTRLAATGRTGALLWHAVGVKGVNKLQKLVAYRVKDVLPSRQVFAVGLKTVFFKWIYCDVCLDFQDRDS